VGFLKWVEREVRWRRIGLESCDGIEGRRRWERCWWEQWRDYMSLSFILEGCSGKFNIDECFGSCWGSFSVWLIVLKGLGGIR